MARVSTTFQKDQQRNYADKCRQGALVLFRQK